MMQVLAEEIQLSIPSYDPNEPCRQHLKIIEAVTITIIFLLCFFIINTQLKKKFKKSYWGYIFIIAFAIFILIIELNTKIILFPEFVPAVCI